MISLNFTLLVEVVLFLVFYGVSRRLLLNRLALLRERRAAQLAGDRASAASGSAAAAEATAQYDEHLTAARQELAQRYRDVRYNAYRENRERLDGLKAEAERQLAEYRDALQTGLEQERQAAAQYVPGLVEAMDRRLRLKGRLL